MPLPELDPIVMTAVGQEIEEPVRLNAIIWEGSTTAGDTVVLRHRDEQETLAWAGRTNDTNTYLGVNLGERGLHCPTGLKLTVLGAGRLLLYRRVD